jgi:small ligand-binding sensory domain FIST
MFGAKTYSAASSTNTKPQRNDGGSGIRHPQARRERPAGALLFTCNGRGTNMFPEPDHDARVVTEMLRTDALAGFFCGGEIGPVGGKAFLHGFTATLAVFLEP